MQCTCGPEESCSSCPEKLESQIAAEFNSLRGRVLGLIESWGLPSLFGEAGQRQENGAKSTFKTLSYDAEARVKELLGD